MQYSTPRSLSSLQVKLELVRQAESLEQVREILEEGVSEAGAPPADASWVSESHVGTKEHRPRWNLPRWTNKAQVTMKYHMKTDAVVEGPLETSQLELLALVYS